MPAFTGLLTLLSVLILILAPGSVRAVEVTLVDALDSDGTVILYELSGGTQVRQTPLRGLPPDTFPRQVSGFARDPRTGDMFLLAIPGPEFGSIPESEPLRLIRVADDGMAQIIGSVLPNRTNPSLQLNGFAIDAAGFGYALQHASNGREFDRVVFFRLDDPTLGGELDPGFRLNALAFHRDESSIYVFGAASSGQRFVAIQPGMPAPTLVSEPQSLTTTDQTFVDSVRIARGTYIGSNRFLFSGSGLLAEVTTSGPMQAATIRDLETSQPQLSSLRSRAAGGLSLHSICGNAVQERGETCESGDLALCDGCSFCQADAAGFICGDNALNATCGEQCDDGGTLSGDGCSATCKVEATPDLRLNLASAASLAARVALGGDAEAGAPVPALCLPPAQVAAVVQQARIAAKRLGNGERNPGVLALARLLELIAVQANAHGGLLDEAGKALAEALLAPTDGQVRFSERLQEPYRGVTTDAALVDLAARIQVSTLRAADKTDLAARVQNARNAATAGNTATLRSTLGGVARRLAEIALDPQGGLTANQTTDLVFATLAALTAFDPAPAIVTVREGIRAGNFQAAAQAHVRAERAAFIAELQETVTPETIGMLDMLFTTQLTLASSNLPAIEFRMATPLGAPATIFYVPDCDGEWRLVGF